jgi:hypothetical protein
VGRGLLARWLQLLLLLLFHCQHSELLLPMHLQHQQFLQTPLTLLPLLLRPLSLQLLPLLQQ